MAFEYMYVYVCDMEWAKKQDFYLGYFFLLTKGGPYTAYIIKKGLECPTTVN